MKCFSGFLLIFVFFFFAACDSVNGVKKVVPENEGNKEAETDEDAEEDDSDSTNEDENADLIDDSGDSSDSDVEPVYDDSSDVEPADNDSTDEKPAGEEDDDVIPDSPEAKCKKVGGTWDSSAQKCYRTETCGDKPEYTEWNGDSTYKVYYDLNVEVWEPLTYPTHYGDGKPEICQYKCIANYSYVNGGCKPYCSAVFDGESSQIQVEHNDLLNLASETWTIEAWIKQGEGDIPTYVIHPIVRKGITSDPAYVLSGYYKQQSGDGYGMTSYVKYSYREWNSTKTNSNRLDPSVTFSDDWTHVAMVKNKETSGAIFEEISYKLLLFVNGTLLGSKNFENTPTVVTNDEVLTIGANLANDGRYFKGLIDSIKISNTAKYTADFTPAKLSAGGDDTIAFWDFSGNADDSSENHLNGVPADSITYSADCKQ